MACCAVCNNLGKKSEDDVRLAFEFVPNELIQSTNRCASCSFILEGIRHFEDQQPTRWSFTNDISRVYATGLQTGSDDITLSLELYFADNRLRQVLEFFYQDREYQKGGSPQRRAEFLRYYLHIIYDVRMVYAVGLSASEQKD